MSHPYFHAISSVRKFGGKVSDYQAIHDWFDATKIDVAHQHHRMFRHHKQAIWALCVEQKRTNLVNSDGQIVSLEAVGEQHLAEDFGGYSPNRQDWVEAISEKPWMRLAPGPSGTAALAICMRRFGGTETALMPIINWFHEGVTDDPRSYYYRGHAAACFWAEALFGTTLQMENGKQIPTRLIAETIVSRMFTTGVIPAAVDWVRALRRPEWFGQPERLAA